MTTSKIDNANEFLKYPEVRLLIGKSTRTITRLVTAGRLTRIGKGASARISKASVLRYLEEEIQAAKAVQTISAETGRNLAQGRELLRRRQEEDKYKRALGKLGGENGGPAANEPTAGQKAMAEKLKIEWVAAHPGVPLAVDEKYWLRKIGWIDQEVVAQNEVVAREEAAKEQARYRAAQAYANRPFQVMRAGMYYDSDNAGPVDCFCGRCDFCRFKCKAYLKENPSGLARDKSTRNIAR